MDSEGQLQRILTPIRDVTQVVACLLEWPGRRPVHLDLGT